MQDLTDEIEKALDLLVKVYKDSTNNKKLILEKSKTIYLQVVLFKTPFTCPRKRKFIRLCHSLYGNDPEICLFVPNRKTGVDYKKTTDELIDFCIDHYRNLLEKHKVKGITTVMPLKQLKSEYGTYELRRKLVNRFDLFLCKNSLLYNSRFLTSLGKYFTLANKEPLGVPFPKQNIDYDPEFNKNIERAIFTSSFYIKRFSDNYSIPFGCFSNTKEELRENLEAVLSQIFDKQIIPGGIKNIRAMYLWPSQSKPVPLYMSSELPVNLKKPKVKSKRKRAKAVEDELSTQPGKKVFVTRSGDVFVTDLDKKSTEQDIEDSEDEESFKDESDVDDDDREKKKEDLNSKDKSFGKKEESESESEDDEEIEEKEARLLMKQLTESDDYEKVKTVQSEEEGQNGEDGANKSREKKLSRKAENKSDNEKVNLSKGKRKDKDEGGKVNKSKRKMLMKKGKLNFTEGKGKSKKKKSFNNN